MCAESVTAGNIQSCKKKRSTKEDQNRLKAHILRILDAGYDLVSIKILLGVRKDKISGCFMDMSADRTLVFSPYRQILPAKNLRGVFGVKESEYWESFRKPNGEISLKPANLHDLRKSLNLCN